MVEVLSPTKEQNAKWYQFETNNLDIYATWNISFTTYWFIN